MANRPKQIVRFWPGVGAAAIVVALTFGTLLAVFLRADGGTQFEPADLSAIRFTVWQAFLSALISVIFAVPVARALARRRFIGRSALITLLGAPFILPAVVAVLALLAVFGRNGLVSVFLGWINLPPVQIYGAHGVVLAHVFFNLPLATRLILQGWTSIPSERFRQAATLGFGPRDIFNVIERPMLREIIPGVFMVIFVICTTSFAVALTLGGGPRATTVELAIYQAFRFDFDLSKAALLGLVQFGICVVAALILFKTQVPQVNSASLDRVVGQWQIKNRPMMWVDVFFILLAASFLLVPLSMVTLRGLPGIVALPEVVWGSALRSVFVALASAGISLGLALSMSIAIIGLPSRVPSRILEGVGSLAIAASPLVLGTGLFILINPIADPRGLALPMTALVNAVMALPFGLRILLPAVRQIEGSYGRLADMLGVSGWARFRVLVLPRLRRQIGFFGGLAAALSMGDLGVIALFAGSDGATLPLQMYRLMGAYQMEAAAGAALLLFAISIGLFWIFDRGGRIDADA